jgi:hypothetical protein
MTTLLEQAVNTARGLPPEMQDDIARMMLLYVGDELPVVDLTPDEEAAVLRSRAAAARGEFATDEQMRAIWAKHGL